MIKQLLTWMVMLAAVGCGTAKQVQKTPEVVPLPPGSFTRAWTANLNLDHDRAERLYLRGNTLFLITRGHASYAIAPTGGQVQFLNVVPSIGGVLRAPIVLPNFIVYPTSLSLEIYNRNGRHARSVSLSAPTSGEIVGRGSVVYVPVKARGSGRLLKIDLARVISDVPRWELYTAGMVAGAPALYDENIYLGSDEGTIVAINERRDGAWPLPNSAFATGGSFVSDIHADETGVYAANSDSKLYALDLETGKILWQYYAGTPLLTSPAVTRTTVYQFVPGRGVVALDKLRGHYNREPKWAVASAVQFLSEDDTNAYLRRRDNTIIAVDKNTGQLRFTSQHRNFEIFATNTTDSTIYATTRRGEVVAIRPVLSAGQVGPLALLK